MKNTRLLALLLALMMALSLFAGCSKTESTTQTTETASTEASSTETAETTETAAPASDEKYVIANTPKCIGIEWWDRMEVGNKAFAEATGHEVYQAGPAGDADTAVQIATIEDCISSGVDIINVIPSDPDACETTLAKAREAGIVVISHEAEGMTNIDYDIEAFVNEDYGAHLMDLLAEQMGEEGGYCLMMGAFTMTSHQQWVAGAIKRQEEAYPNMYQVCDPVESAAGGGTSNGSYKVAKEVIAAYPEVKGFIGCDMADPPGIAMAVEEAGKAGQIAVTGTCLVSCCQQYLENGTIKVFSAWDPAIAGQAMSALGVLVKQGVEIVDGIDLGVPGFESCTLKGNILYGSAWFDGTLENMADYNF